MRIWQKWVLTLILLSSAVPASALLNIELTRWANNAIPIAIVPFAGQEAAPQDVASVINNDLKNSGRFVALDVNKMPEQPHDAASVKSDVWKGKGADYIAVGKLDSLGGDQYRVTVALVNPSAATRDLIFNEKFTVAGKDLRRLSHHISDMIYERLIGIRGVFSTRLAYVQVQRSGGNASYQLMVADADGYNPRSLLSSNQPIMSPAWSPDSKQIAYVSFESGQPQIYVQSVVSGARRVLTQYKGINGAPAWSPDGSKLAVVLSKTGHPKIYTVSVASGGLQQLTDGYSIDTEPSFAPDGRSVIFTSNRGGTPQIYKLDIASRKVDRLTFNGKYNARAQYTPDGKSIIMLHQDDGGGFVIAQQNLQSGVLTLLTRSPLDESPSVAPNGSMVLYSTNEAGRLMLGMVATDGHVKLQLPGQGGDVQSPAWSSFTS